MKIKVTGIISVVLSIVMLIGVVSIFASCEKQKSDETPTPVVEEKTVTIVENGKTSYKIVRAQNADANTVDMVTGLQNSITQKFSCSMELATDLLNEGETADPEAYEILVGNTDREETKAVLETLESNSWAIVLKGNKIVICANNDALLPVAIDWFVSSYVAPAGAALNIPEALDKSEGYGDAIPLSINGNTSYSIVYQIGRAHV